MLIVRLGDIGYEIYKVYFSSTYYFNKYYFY